MNIVEVIIDFENEDANDLPVPAWSEAVDTILCQFDYNPEEKTEEELADAYFDAKEKYGLVCHLDQSGFGLTVSVYQIFEPRKKTDCVETRTALTDGYQVTYQPSSDYDAKYFVIDSAKVAEQKINLKSLFGQDWKDYLTLISDMKFGNYRMIERAEGMRASAHNGLAYMLQEKLEAMGIRGQFQIYSSLRSFISMLVEYHYQYGNVSAHKKIGMVPPKSEPR